MACRSPDGIFLILSNASFEGAYETAPASILCIEDSIRRDVMRTKISSICAAALLCALALSIYAQAQSTDGTPHLQKQGTATQLIVDGKPYMALAGELTNNAATSIPAMEAIWPQLVAANLNTVLVGVSWAQFEPEEGKFNYEQVDGVIAKARQNNLHVVFIWFASWKNGTSSFAPY
jgi:GH35 family endo-1,4-beta-xylanase